MKWRGRGRGDYVCKEQVDFDSYPAPPHDGTVPECFAAVYRARGMQVPHSHSGHSLAALIPLEDRLSHKIHATRNGWFWLPCPLCGTEFGGHEITDSIPDPARGPGAGQCICPFCTIKRNTPEEAAA